MWFADFVIMFSVFYLGHHIAADRTEWAAVRPSAGSIDWWWWLHASAVRRHGLTVHHSQHIVRIAHRIVGFTVCDLVTPFTAISDRWVRHSRTDHGSILNLLSTCPCNACVGRHHISPLVHHIHRPLWKTNVIQANNITSPVQLSFKTMARVLMGTTWSSPGTSFFEPLLGAVHILYNR